MSVSLFCAVGRQSATLVYTSNQRGVLARTISQQVFSATLPARRAIATFGRVGSWSGDDYSMARQRDQPALRKSAWRSKLPCRRMHAFTTAERARFAEWLMPFIDTKP